MGKVRKGFLPSILILFSFSLNIIRFFGDIDFIIERTKDIGWLAIPINFLMNPIFQILLILIGFGWLYLVFIFKKTSPLKIEHNDNKDGYYEQALSTPEGMFNMPISNNLIWRLCRISVCNTSHTETIKNVKVQLTSINQSRLRNQTPLDLNYQHNKEKPYKFSTDLSPGAREFVNVVMWERLSGTSIENYRIVSINEDSVITSFGVDGKDYKITIKVTGEGSREVEREFCFGIKNKDNTFGKIWLWPNN